ncbi:4Fe-4S binding protein [Candidatus Dojkabacteria bacterium]|nr:4Fe-4S binding protein [Candidatus Dojkabacteria bacterium]
MKKIAVTGGKGGTGKSTFSILFALKEISRRKKVLLVDCDVECPNDYIILGIKKLEDSLKKTYTYYPEILKSKCTKCGMCVKSCRSNAIFQPKGKFPQINEELCSSCGVCWTICPEKAIIKKKVENGEIYLNEIKNNFTLVTGISKPGIRETSPVVKETKQFVETMMHNFDLIIYDTAAGSHCTVMAALEGVEKAYAVTEPTPVGAHDLNIILKVLKVMKIRSEVVANQYDVGDMKKIINIARENKTQISVRILYNKVLAKDYSSGNFLHNESLIHLLD